MSKVTKVGNFMATTITNSQVGMVLRPEVIKEFTTLLPHLITWLTRRKKEILFLEAERERLKKILPEKHFKAVTFAEIPQFLKTDGPLLSLGGDGTLIGLCRKVKGISPPIFGVNLGRLGFITEFSRHSLYEDLEIYFKGGLLLESFHPFLAVIESQGKTPLEIPFINDAVISKNSISRMFTLGIELDDGPVVVISGDGVIFSTPIGSTAYSLAAGGPIVHPGVPSLVVTPICPHGPAPRPMVLPENLSVKTQLGKGEDHVLLTIDGQEAISITHKDTVSIRKDTSRTIRMIKNPARTYFDTLRDKLLFEAKGRIF